MKALLASILGLALCLHAGPVHSRSSDDREAPMSITVESVRDVAYAGVINVSVKVYVLRIWRPDGRDYVRVTFGGPSKTVQGEIQRTAIIGDHLLVTTPSNIGVFDLKTGREEKLLDAMPVVAPSRGGAMVAFKEFQSRSTPPEAETTVVRVLDIQSREVYAVFPQPKAITKNQSGFLQVWEEDPAQRHIVVSDLFWSPSDARLLFFCKHSAGPVPGEQVLGDYVVVVDLGRGPSQSRFVHQLIPPDQYLKPLADTKDRKILFNVDAVTWLDTHSVELKTPPEFRWLKEKIVLELPSFD